MARSDLRRHRLAELIEGFDHYVAAFDRDPPFRRKDQLESHEQTIRLLRSLGSVTAAIDSEAFVGSLWRTLRAWQIGTRGSSLADLPTFQAVLHTHAPAIQALEGNRIESAGSSITDAIWELVCKLDVTYNKARLVATTKTLHHLLPDLIPPVDRAYTGSFFSWQPQEFQTAQEKIFRSVWAGFVQIARRASPGSLVSDTP
jgi:hypothetical protein